MGPRDARRLDDRRRRRLARAARRGPARPLLRRDRCRSGGRSGSRRRSAGRPRRVRGVRRRRCSRRRGRSRSATSRGTSRARAPPAARTGDPAARAAPARRLRVDALAVDRAAAAVDPRGLRASAGAPWSGPSPAGSSPAGRRGGRLLPAAFRQMPQALAADRRVATLAVDSSISHAPGTPRRSGLIRRNRTPKSSDRRRVEAMSWPPYEIERFRRRGPRGRARIHPIPPVLRTSGCLSQPRPRSKRASGRQAPVHSLEEPGACFAMPGGRYPSPARC